MNIISPDYKIVEQKPGLQGIYEQIELAGKTCYASNHNIKYDEDGNSLTAEGFVNRMVDSGHGAMLEHGTVYLKVPIDFPDEWSEDDRIHNFENILSSPYSRTKSIEECDTDWYCTTNYRVIIENNAKFLLEYLCEPTEYHEKRITVVFNTDRTTGESFLRHRTISEDHPDVETSLDERNNSFARQSTRYCNYANNRFNNEITICSNSDYSKDEIEERYNMWNYEDGTIVNPIYNMCESIVDFSADKFTELDYFIFANLACEWVYMNMIRLGANPQQARRILPFDINSPLVMTAFEDNWAHFFNLRVKDTTGTAHPDAKLVATPLYYELIDLGYRV